LEASQQSSFLQGRLPPRPTPILADQASVFISPRGRVATHFSHLLRHAWVTVGLFLFPGHHTGNFKICMTDNSFCKRPFCTSNEHRTGIQKMLWKECSISCKPL
jgi:hypothetical protein